MGNEAAAIPEKIGNFRIVGKIGQGGMGAVFRAVHGTLERPVALKLLPAELAGNPEYVARFLREARAVAALRHDNVVQVYDAGEEDGRYYIAMELVDGCNLLKYIEDKKPINEAEGRALLLQAAKGLAAAHAKGLVHRDIKPENILLGKDNILRLVDFGLVMESASTTQLTATGACLGTPMYMSPEQADGEHADARTDIYSLGVTFFRVFTGQPPFTSPTVMNLLFKHKFEAPPDPKAVRPDLSQDTRNLLLHMMTKRREDRPQSAQALVEMIEGIARGKPVPPPPEFVPAALSGTAPTMLSPGAALPATARSSRRNVMAGVAVLLAILAAGIVFAVTRPGKGGPSPAPPVIETPDPAPKPDFAAKGDEAFTAGRYADALENYSKALAEKPDDQGLKDKIAKTEQARRCDELMQTAEALEAKGDLEAAESRYSEAARFERGAKARDRAERIRAAIAKGKGLTNKQRNAELDMVSRKAADAEKACEFEVAAEYYSRAASLSDGAVRTVFADKAQECRRQDYQAKGMAAEELKTYAEAERWYKKALEIKADPLLQQKLEAVQQKNRPVAAELPPHAAMREGQKALEAGDFVKARVEFTLALTYRAANDPEITAKLKEVDGRELLAKGDAFRAAGDTANALSSYAAALQKCPALESQAA
ncbi:MAG: protein kinase, partial [Planctomycetota bacterium]|nr:protein kinase [Planctomycetota bacterium]